MTGLLEGMRLICILLCAVSLIRYLPRFICWFGALKPQKHYHNEKNNRFAVIIPAKNESKVIGGLLESLAAQSYPSELFDIHTVIKEPDDPTKVLVKACGGSVYVAENQTCKGDALDFCIKRILADSPDKYDAFIILDADCLCAGNFLAEMNNALATDASVILSKKLVKNYYMNKKGSCPLVSCCNGIIWTIIDELGNRWKSDHGATIMTIGTGLLLRADFMRELGGWPYRATVTEDMELMFDIAGRGLKTAYCSYAHIYMEEATSISVTNMRRTRWLNGLIAAKRIYNDSLRYHNDDSTSLKNKYFVKALWPVFGYIGTLTVFSAINLLFAALLALSGNELFVEALFSSFAALGVIYFSFWLMTLFCIIIDRRYIKLGFLKKTALLFVHPLFYMGYIKICGRALFFPPEDKCWEPVERVDTGEEKYKIV